MNNHKRWEMAQKYELKWWSNYSYNIDWYKNYSKTIITEVSPFIIITKEKVTYKGTLETFINKIYRDNKQFTQIFCLSDFLYDITEHILCPKYRILTEKSTYLEKKIDIGILTHSQIMKYNLMN